MQASHQQSCLEILNNLQTEKYYEKTRYFLTPVQDTIDESEWQLYKSIIKTPKDLKTIQENLLQNKYSSISAFSKDVSLCFENAIKYNKQRYKPVYQAAMALQKVFNAQMEKLVSNLPRGLSLPTSIPPPPVPTPPPPPPLRSITTFDSSLGVAIVDTISNLKAAQWFTVPIDLTMPLYTKRISSPMDLPTIRDNLQKRKYVTPDQFALDMRRVFANSLVYNFDVSRPEFGVAEIRNDSKTCLFKFEEEWHKIYERRISPALHELRECLDAIEEILKVIPEGTTGPAILSFIDPVRVYYEGDNAWLKKYSQIIKKPMDYGTIISGICEARYSHVEEILNDAKLIAENCEKFYASTTKTSIEAARLKDPLTMDAWMLYQKFHQEVTTRTTGIGSATTTTSTRTDPSIPLERQASVESIGTLELDHIPLDTPKLKITKSKRGSSSSGSVISSTAVAAITAEPKEMKKSQNSTTKKTSKPQEKVAVEESYVTSSPSPAPKKSKVNINVKDRYLWCLSELKMHHLTENGVVGVQTCWPFILAVDPIQYPSYYLVITNPMDLSTVERKIKGEKYSQLISILRDIELIRNNAHTFNPGDLGKDIRYLADLTLSNFKFLLKQVALEILNCGDDTFIQKYLPSDTVPLILQPDPLEPISSSFYLPRLNQSLEETHEEKPTLTRRKSTSKLSKLSTPSVDNQLSNEEVGYLLSQEDSGWVNEDVDSPFDYSEELFQNGSVARPTPSKKANKGKRKKSGGADEIIPEPALIRLPSTITPIAPWEQDCFDMLKKITRHEFLDLSKPNPKAFKADFFHPVVELFPDLATSYLLEIKNPMDFSIIYDRLTRHGFLDCQGVYEKIILIFQNTIDFNEPHISENDHSPDAEFARKMVSRSKHMITYVKWLANEMLPIADDTNEPHPESLGELRTGLRDQYRRDRNEIIMNAPIDVHRDCNALLKKFENRKYMKDYLFFARPVPVKDIHDYLVYVRHPMDFYTIKEKLDKHKYPTFGHFIKDLRLIFTNAKTYNKVHMETDPFSKSCYEAAILLGNKLEEWLQEDFSIDVAERMLYNKIKIDEGAVVEAQRKEIKEKMDQELDDFRKQEIARLKSSDLMFAADQMRREYISGTLEPGANTTLLTPRSVPTERPPMFYEPESVEVIVPSHLSASSTSLAMTQASQENSTADLIRENIWDYWKTNGVCYEKHIFPPSPCEGMELVRSDSDTRLSRTDSQDSHEPSKQLSELPLPPAAPLPPLPLPLLPTYPTTEPLLPLESTIDSSSTSKKYEELHFTSFQLQPIRKKLKTPFESTSLASSSTSQSSSSSSKKTSPTFKKGTSPSFITPFSDENDSSLLPSENINKLKSSRAKRGREKELPSSEQSNPQTKKMRESLDANEPEKIVKEIPSHPPQLKTEKSGVLRLGNICSLFDHFAPVSCIQTPAHTISTDTTSNENILIFKYQTCNGINLFRILTPCYRQYDELNVNDGVEDIPSQSISFEEQKSQTSSLPDLGRESSLTLSDPSPSGVANCLLETHSLPSIDSVGQLKEHGDLNSIQRNGGMRLSTSNTDGLPTTGLLLHSLPNANPSTHINSIPAAMNAKRKFELDNIRKILSSTTRFGLEQKFKDELLKKKLLGCFGTKKGSEELRKRALSLLKTPSDGLARVQYSNSQIQVIYPIKSSIHLLSSIPPEPPLSPLTHSSKSKNESKNEIQFLFHSSSSQTIISNLFGQSHPSHSLTQVCELTSPSTGFEIDGNGFSTESQNEFLTCFNCQNHHHSTHSQPIRRWHHLPSTSNTSVACHHISNQNKPFPTTYLKIINSNSNDSNLCLVSGILPIDGMNQDEAAPPPLDSRHVNKVDYNLNPRIHLSLQQISRNIFISPTCQEVSSFKKKFQQKEQPSWQKYLESWIMMIDEYNPSLPSLSSSLSCSSSSQMRAPLVDLLVLK